MAIGIQKIENTEAMTPPPEWACMRTAMRGSEKPCPAAAGVSELLTCALRRE